MVAVQHSTTHRYRGQPIGCAQLRAPAFVPSDGGAGGVICKMASITVVGELSRTTDLFRDFAHGIKAARGIA